MMNRRALNNHPFIAIGTPPQDPVPEVSPTEITGHFIHGIQLTGHATNTNQHQAGGLQLTGVDVDVNTHADANVKTDANVKADDQVSTD